MESIIFSSLTNTFQKNQSTVSPSINEENFNQVTKTCCNCSLYERGLYYKKYAKDVEYN
jgi:hypothetical protein